MVLRLLATGAERFLPQERDMDVQDEGFSGIFQYHS